ncbi:MAG: hypothetical protein C0404_10675 [Verrucomicrobia bacterium]|nr:hypothetical protein [Verrucomicrobiota bacterium]
MTAQQNASPDQKHGFLREMTEAVADALDRLPLWLSCDAGLTTEDVADTKNLERLVCLRT